jgi:hypothetical protein
MDGVKEQFQANTEIFLAGMDGLMMDVSYLEDNDVVADVVRYCTGKEASKEIIGIFQWLKIEEHFGKVSPLIDAKRAALKESAA